MPSHIAKAKINRINFLYIRLLYYQPIPRLQLASKLQLHAIRLICGAHEGPILCKYSINYRGKTGKTGLKDHLYIKIYIGFELMILGIC